MSNVDEFNQLSDTSFDLGDLFSFIWQYKFRIVLLTTFLIISAGFFVLQLPKVYIASSTLLLSENSSNTQMPSLAGLTVTGKDSEMDTYIEFIRSRQFITIIITDLALQDEKEFNPEDPNDTDFMGYAIDKFSSNLTLNKVRNTDMLRLNFASYSAKLATKIVNSIGPAFFRFHTNLQQQKVRDSSIRLNSQLEEITNRLTTAEKKLQSYQDQYGIVDVRIQIEMAKNEITSLIKEQLANDKLISEETASIAQIGKVSTNEKMLLQIPWMMKNSLLRNLQNQILLQSKVLSEVSKRYKSKHHRYIAAKSTLITLKKDLSELITQLVDSLKESIKRHQVRRKELKLKITIIKDNLNELGKQEYQLTKLTRDLETMQKVSELFTNRLRETDMLQGIGMSKEFAIVDFAAEPKFPSKPKVTLIMLMVSIVSALFSIVFWLILHFRNDKETTYRQTLRQMNIPVLISLPRVKRTFMSRSTLPLRSAKGETSYKFSEAIRSLRTSILIGQNQHKNKIVAITSTYPAEGKATLVINLAESCSNMEKVLLADIDLSRPSIAKAFQLSKNQPGITDYFTKDIKFGECLHHENINRLTVLPSGHIPKDPLAMISTQRFVDFIEKLRLRFDRLIFEAPPIKTISDALILSRLVDGVIVVCDMEITEVNILVKTIQRLKEADITVLGVVFNRAR